MKQKYLLGALLCAVTPLVCAVNNAQDEIIVTATRIPQAQQQSLASTTVITQNDIKASQAADLATILRGVAGVELSQNGGFGKTTSLFLRGSNAMQVLVLLDGVRINSATTGTASLQNLLLDQVERIEVVRGNVSSLYGSEAVGGVVQIFTKRGRGEPKPNASAGLGSYGTQRVAAGFGGAVNNTDFNVQVSSFKTNGISALNPQLKPKANPGADGYRNTSVSANVRHVFNTDHSVSLSAFQSQGDNQYDSAFGKPTDINTNRDVVSKLSLAADNRLTENWQSHLQFAQGVDDNQNWTNGKASATGSRYKTKNNQFTWQNNLLLTDTSQLLLGVEQLNQNVSSDVKGGYAITQRKVGSLLAGYTGNYAAHQVQINARQDRNSQYGTVGTGLLGYGYAFNDTWRATVSYSTGFRAPTFNELYYPGFGNVQLKPEHARNGELGVHYANGTQHVDVVYFDNRTRDLIAYAPGPVNVNQARVDGGEISYSGQFDDTGIKAALTSQNPRDVATGKALVRRAKLHSSLAVSHTLNDWQLGGEWLYSGTRQDAGKTLASYNVLNFTATYAINKELKLALRAENLTNQNDSTVYAYNPLGRTLFVGLNYQP